jgi:hypothetical protein
VASLDARASCAAGGVDRGNQFRRVNKVGKAWGDGMTEKSVWDIAEESANAIGLDKLAHQDLRRCDVRAAVPRFGRRTGADPISFWDVSVQTTECYLGCKQRIQAAVND